MERSKLGIALGLSGTALFFITLLVILPLQGIFYVLSLFGMFSGVVMIAIGLALLKGIDQSLEADREKCYYCKGTGKTNEETCPRCGGTGISPEDD